MPPRVIAVPQTDRGAYNPNRPAGTLLRSQALHMREALVKHVQELTALVSIDLNSLKSEADISSYVHRATALLHTHRARPRSK